MKTYVPAIFLGGSFADLLEHPPHRGSKFPIVMKPVPTRPAAVSQAVPARRWGPLSHPEHVRVFGCLPVAFGTPLPAGRHG